MEELVFYPHVKNTDLKVLSIDPGTHKTGLAFFEIDPVCKKLLKLTAWTVYATKLKNDTGLVEDFFSDRFLRLYKLRNELIRVFEKESPDIIVYEGPFVHGLKPSAFGPLVALQTLVQDAVINYNSGIPFITIQPQQAKKAIGVAGKKGKDVVRESISNNKELNLALKENNIDFKTLSEDSLDAIAVGYYAIRTFIF